MEKQELVEKIHGVFQCTRLAIARAQQENLELIIKSYKLIKEENIPLLRKHIAKMEKKLKYLQHVVNRNDDIPSWNTIFKNINQYLKDYKK